MMALSEKLQRFLQKKELILGRVLTPKNYPCFFPVPFSLFITVCQSRAYLFKQHCVWLICFKKMSFYVFYCRWNQGYWVGGFADCYLLLSLIESNLLFYSIRFIEIYSFILFYSITQN